MNKAKPNKIPQPRTIARHYAEGKVCDYPSDIIFSAVNSFDYNYNSITIPIKLIFIELFLLNIDTFIYLVQHRSESVFKDFLSGPNEYMANVGIQIEDPIDAITSKIMVAMLEDEMFEAIMSSDQRAVSSFLHIKTSSDWHTRHTERYDSEFMMPHEEPNVEISKDRLLQQLEKANIPAKLLIDLHVSASFFQENCNTDG